MPNLIEDIINEVLTDGVQKYALDFVAYLRANEMLFESGKGYWKDEFYWMIKFEGEYVCFIQIGGDERKDNSWTIWSDDSDSKWFEDYPLDERLRKIAWENVDICGNCGGCSIPGGDLKTRFGKEFNNVCIATLRFNNPDAEALECAKKMVEIRKSDIIGDI